MNISIPIKLATIATAILFQSCTTVSKEGANDDPKLPAQPVNIILMIGDGMGLSQVSSSFYFNDQRSNFWRFKHIGLIKTSSSSHQITDSASGATAFSCGEKTYNGAINVDKDGNQLIPITDILARKNYKNGIISTSSVTHATPACFFATADKRSKEELIASQLHLSNVDFIAGGGLDFFTKREDQSNYLDTLKSYGFEVGTESLPSSSDLKIDQKYSFLLSPKGMPPVMEGRGEFLRDATAMAAGFLSGNDEGFFLMVEGSQIDWGGHANNGEYTISEVIDFDKAIGAALDFAEQDGNTLVIVTADHETGGFTLAASTKTNDQGTTSSDYNEVMATFSTGGHSTTLIPVFAYGPGAENFSGIYENTDIFHKMMAIAGKN